ncbi:hypothetical protein [Yersinia aleksiciae]|uniref:hypothetical protein n=1 Tax=Yersinia aleksiciae TaxID=263819 RepID=UPI00119E8738|nr:hypothetical protein [Yersinia aleksiciae]
MIKTITAAPVERDGHGFWTHPDFFEPANGNEFGVEGEFDAWKALNRVVGKLEWMECEENAEELQAAYDTGDYNLNIWQPKPPAGDGWFMGSIHDTEDGPVCYWLRPIECDPKALAAHFDNCYAEAFKIEHLVAERDAALNTCSLIAEALGITGAVAGDTIARVQQLIGENAVMLKLLTDISENHSEFVDEVEDCMCASIPLDYVSEINAYVSRDVNAENPFPATDAAINEIKAQGVDEWIASRNGRWNGTTKEAEEFAASLRGE